MFRVVRRGNALSCRTVPNHVTVFTGEYVGTLRRRWETRPEREWPLVARVALQNDRADDREMTEGWVAELNPADQGRVASTLRTERQFLSTFGELIGWA
jgi:hypothetical protein